MKVLNIIGTAREGRKSVYAAKHVNEAFSRKGHDAEVFDLKDRDVRPLGNRTYVDDEEPVPDFAQDLSEKVREADLVVITTPEYNHSFPGVLKTALDHLFPEFEQKPVGFVTVSSGGFGGVRALSHLHDVFLTYDSFIGPDLQISRVGDVFDEDGKLIDEAYGERFQGFVEQSEKFREKLENGIE